MRLANKKRICDYASISLIDAVAEAESRRRRVDGRQQFKNQEAGKFAISQS